MGDSVEFGSSYDEDTAHDDFAAQLRQPIKPRKPGWLKRSVPRL